MKNGKSGNNLIVIEDGHLTSYVLDDKNIWELGRSSSNHIPDISLKTTTISRRHGKFQNMDGIWFYLDYNEKNGTVYNQNHMEPGLHGRIKPVMLKNQDVFVFGGGTKEAINSKTVWALYVIKVFEENWIRIDSKGYTEIQFIVPEGTTVLKNPKKGTVIDREEGIGIYMGDWTYLIGEMKLKGSS